MQTPQHKWDAADYARNSSAQQQWANELIAKLGLQGGESILDIGCGDGKITAQLALAANKGSVLGIDLSEDMIRLAVTQFPPKTYPNLSFQHMDATGIHLPGKFDVVFSNAALHWVKDHLAVLHGIHACLKPGGRMLLQMGGRGNAPEIFDVLDVMTQDARWKPYYEGFTPPYHFYGPEEYAAWLPETGLRPARVELLPKDMQHQGAEALKGWLRTAWFPYTDRLPVELRESFLAEVVETHIAAHPLDSLGNTHVKMVRLEVEAYAPL